jgi:hypothetical protein
MKRGSYFFYDDRISPGKQAELWASLLRDDYPEMQIWADWENTYGGAYGGLANVVAFMQRVEQLLPGVKIGLYTGYFWFRGNSNAVTNASQYTYLKTRPLFLAWYTNNAANVLVPQPWSSIFLWQFGTPSEGHAYGVGSAEIDMSYINMTEADFQIRYGGVVVPPGGGVQIIKGTVKGSVKRRDAVQGSEFVPPRYLRVGDQIEASENSAQWLHLTKINGSPVVGTEWASAGPNQEYISWHWETVTEPPSPPPVETDPDYIVAYWVGSGVSKKYIPE